MFERAGQVCLVEEPSLVDGIENGDALLQEIRRISSAFDLAKSTVGHARGLQKMPLHRPPGQCRMHAPQRVFHGAITCDHAALHEAGYKTFRILEVWIFPSGAIQPKRPTSRS